MNDYFLPFSPSLVVPEDERVDFLTPMTRPRTKVVIGQSIQPPVSPNTAKGMLGPGDMKGLALDDEVTEMCASMPITKACESIILRCDGNDHTAAREIILETVKGERIATLDSDPAKERRTLRDADGELCAIIQHTDVDGRHRFKISGPNKMTVCHRRSKDSGYYAWADVKNSSGIKPKFLMKMRGDTKSRYKTEAFGPSLLKWGSPRGFLIKQDEEPCARITYLGGDQGIVFAPNVDKCLMLCFALIIEEMVKNRMR